MFYSQPVYERHSPVQPQLTETRLVQVPVSYIPMEQGQKRILSPESVENAQEKRTRHISFDLSSSQPSASAGGGLHFGGLDDRDSLSSSKCGH